MCMDSPEHKRNKVSSSDVPASKVAAIAQDIHEALYEFDEDTDMLGELLVCD